MEKPDLAKIGKSIGEDAVKAAISQAVRPYAEYYIMQSENKIDDILLPFLDQLEKAVLEVADKIDGEEG